MNLKVSQFRPRCAGGLVAIGNGAAFRKGREFAALARRRAATVFRLELLGISKRGNVYLRKVFIHGARAAVLRIK